jgi:hypothetical protein
MDDDDEYKDERSEFEKLVSNKVIKVQMDYYKDVGYPDGPGTRFDAWAVCPIVKVLKDRYSN